MTSVLTMEGEIMNRQLIGMLFAGCLLALLAAVPAQAQLPGIPIRVTIPFDFSIRGKTLPSGKYEIRRLGDEPDGLLVYNIKNHQHAVFESEPVQTSRAPSLSIPTSSLGDSPAALQRVVESSCRQGG